MFINFERYSGELLLDEEFSLRIETVLSSVNSFANRNYISRSDYDYNCGRLSALFLIGVISSEYRHFMEDKLKKLYVKGVLNE